MEHLYLGLLAFVSSLFALALAKLFFPLWGFMDKPEKYGHDRAAIPYSVGILFFIVFLSFVLIGLDLTMNLKLILISLVVLVFTSFLDDLFDIPAIFRLIVQVCCAGLVVYAGAEVLEFSNPLGDSPIQLGVFSFVVSVLWIVLLTNLLNFLDGVSGLSSGVSCVGFFVLFGLSIWPGMHVTDQSMVSYMAVVLGSIALVAAIFEFPTPKVLMGDSGAMFFGFMLGVLSLLNGGKLATVALVLLVPIFDGLWAISRRIYRKESPFKGDLGHVHHRLLDMGVSQQRLVGGYYLLSIVFGVIALFSWNTFFKVVSLVLIFVGFSLATYFLWIQEKK